MVLFNYLAIIITLGEVFLLQNILMFGYYHFYIA